MAGNGNAKIIDLKEELTPLHTGLWGNTTNITKGEFNKTYTHTHTHTKEIEIICY